MQTDPTYDRVLCYEMMEDVRARARAAFLDLAQRHARAQALLDEAKGLRYAGDGVPSVNETKARAQETYEREGIGTDHTVFWCAAYIATWSQIINARAAREKADALQARLEDMEEQLASLQEALPAVRAELELAAEHYYDLLQPLSFSPLHEGAPPKDANTPPLLQDNPDRDADLPF